VLDEERVRSVREQCDRFLFSPGARHRIAEELADLAEYAADRRPDWYGRGGLADDVESQVADLLGKPAAVFLPSGIMAQQIALRVWADDTGRDTIALHRMAHIDAHELGAAWELHRLRPRYLTADRRLPTLEDLHQITGPVGCVTLELPLRQVDHSLPSWDDYVALCAAAHERGARVHLDGARLWESTVHFGHSLAEIAAQADSVYVSFYKSLGGISGSALAGPAPFVSAVREWRHRHGGTLVTQYPAMLAALRGLERTLPRVGEFVHYAAELAEAIAALPGVRVSPRPPHTNAFVGYFDRDADAMVEAALAFAEERRVWPPRWFPAEVPGWSVADCTVAETTLAWKPAEVAAMLAEILDRAS
jgi:threonine aldolase